MCILQKEILQFRKTIWKFYTKHKRNFPWRRTRNPYAILISEVMLQQTQVERVVPFFNRWMKKFPTVEVLARAPLKEVLPGWQGLGYNRRALALKGSAEMIMKEYGGIFPKSIEEIDALPGVGPYTAGAIAAFAFNAPSVFIETNIRTVYLHFFFKGRANVRDEQILALVAQTLPNKVRPFSRYKVEPCSVREWYNALMDYGAMLKATVGNLNIKSASYAKQSSFKGSKRELRGEILRRATKGKVTSADFTEAHSGFPPMEILLELVKEGFLRREGSGFRLA